MPRFLSAVAVLLLAAALAAVDAQAEKDYREAIALPGESIPAVQAAAAIARMSPADRARCLVEVADKRPELAARVAERWLLDPDDMVAGAAAAAINRSWPTALQHLVLLRALLDRPGLGVRLAALGALVHARDDGAVPSIIGAWRRAEPEHAQTFHRGLIALAGADQGAEPSAWEGWYTHLKQEGKQLKEALDAAVAKNDWDRARMLVHELMLNKGHAGVAADVLIPLLDSGNQRLAALAEVGLRNKPSPAGILALRERGLGGGGSASQNPLTLMRPAATPAPEAPAPVAVAAVRQPAPVEDTFGWWWVVVLALVGGGGWLWWRRRPAAPTPAKPGTHVFTLDMKKR